jgi:RNA-binding protein Musashi
VKEEPPAAVEPKLEDAVEQHEANGDMEVQTYDAEPDEDDDIDFNLGNGNGYDSPANHDAHGPGIKEDG